MPFEKNGSLPFQDIQISRENQKLVTSVYQKPTFIGIFTNLESFISKSHICNLIDSLLYRGFSLCSNMKKFPQETLNSIFKSNGYPLKLHQLINKKKLDQLFAKNKMNLTVPKLICMRVAQQGKPSLDLRASLRCTIEKNKPFFKLYVVFRSDLVTSLNL